jgi:hypothetical protein
LDYDFIIREGAYVKKIFFLTLSVMLLMACAIVATPASQRATLVPTIALSTVAPVAATMPPTYTPTPTQTIIAYTPTPTETATLAYPVEGRGPTGFAPDVDPLTGQQVLNPALLDRRPIVIKVENLPRDHRPQWGLSLADLVYEYYTEFGATRFAAIFYGSDAERVGPIRSGRFFDANLVQMYQSIFIYGSAYPDVQSRFFNSDFYTRLILETTKSCPTLCRFDPNGQNLLVANTSTLNDYLVTRAVDNTRQNLDGMLFKLPAPASGTPGSQVFVRYSGAIYNRWDYEPASGTYLRFVDAADDVNRNNPVYAQLTDRLTGRPVAAQNLVMLCVPHQYYVKTDEGEVLDIIMDSQRIPSYVGCDGQTYTGNNGPAYVFRDGQKYQLTWKRNAKDSILTLIQPDGSTFPLKPGQTWFEVVGASSTVEDGGGGVWRFTHRMVP